MRPCKRARQNSTGWKRSSAINAPSGARRAIIYPDGALRGGGVRGREAAVDAPYAISETLEPGIARLLARNPSPYTYYGTQTYLAGTDALVVIDPGPDISEHVDAILEAT